MSNPLDAYKNLIDGLVKCRDSVTAEWVTDKKPWPDLPENKKINEFISQLNSSQREILALLLQDARDGAIHDLFAYLNEEFDLNGLRFTKNGQELPHEPFGTELHFDWTCRKEGDDWPEPENSA